jgi:hypothetical protein
MKCEVFSLTKEENLQIANYKNTKFDIYVYIKYIKVVKHTIF